MPATFIIFGASGDLTSRKLVPALYKLHRKGRLRDGLRVVGFSRSPFSHDEWRKALAETTAKFAGEEFDPGAWEEFAKNLYYHSGDIGQPDDFDALRDFLKDVEGGQPCPRVYYLSTSSAAAASPKNPRAPRGESSSRNPSAPIWPAHAA
jgi:glucose-6-phosphate 1-dehydrogenase